MKHYIKVSALCICLALSLCACGNRVDTELSGHNKSPEISDKSGDKSLDSLTDESSNKLAGENSNTKTGITDSPIVNHFRTSHCYYEITNDRKNRDNGSYNYITQYDLDGNLITEFKKELQIEAVYDLFVDDTHLYYGGLKEYDGNTYQLWEVPIQEKNGSDEVQFSQAKNIYERKVKEWDSSEYGMVFLSDSYIVWDNSDQGLQRYDRETEEVKSLPKKFIDDCTMMYIILDQNTLFLEEIDTGRLYRLRIDDWDIKALKKLPKTKAIFCQSLPRTGEKQLYYVTSDNTVMRYDAESDKTEEIISSQEFEEAVQKHSLGNTIKLAAMPSYHAWGVMYPQGEKMMMVVESDISAVPTDGTGSDNPIEYTGFQIFSFHTGKPDGLQYEKELSEALLTKTEATEDPNSYMLTNLPYGIMQERMLMLAGFSDTPSDLERYVYDRTSGKTTKLKEGSDEDMHMLRWFAIQGDGPVF